MLFGLPGRQSLVPEEFNVLCSKTRVEARVTPAPNPGDPFHALRVINFRNFNNVIVIVTQFNKRKTVTKIPPNGEAQIMLLPNEELPTLEKERA